MSTSFGRAALLFTTIATVLSIAADGVAQPWLLPHVEALSERVDLAALDEGSSRRDEGPRVSEYEKDARRARSNSDARPRARSIVRPRGPAPGFAPRPGQRVFRLAIPSIGVDEWVVQGTNQVQLARGPGHYPDCGPDFALPYCSRFEEVWPGERGRVIVGGHRTLATRPFFELGEVGRGDRIRIRAPWGRFVYVVRKRAIVASSDASVIRAGVPRRELVLVTCHPKFSAAQRLVVFSKLAVH